MDQQAILHITAMMNSFRPSGEDIELRMRVLADRLQHVSTAAISAACKRFEDGEVKGQDTKKPPTVPEFVKEAKQQQEYIDIRNRPQPLPKPVHRGGPAPFEITQEKAKAEMAGRPVLHKNVDNDRWRALSKSKELPTGAVWVACLGTVYGPAPTKQEAE